jgi:predicted PurR-regulated permease PerM
VGHVDEELVSVVSGSNGASPPEVLVLPAGAQRELDESHESLGALGRPFSRQMPYFAGLTGGLGLATAYAIARGIAEVASVLVIVGLALFLAIGLDPIVVFLMKRRISRGLAVAIVTFGFLAFLAFFAFASFAPISHEVTNLITNYPKYKAELAGGKGWAGRLVVKLHLQRYLKGPSKLGAADVGGILGAGKILLSAGVATISVAVLTIYFLIALPGVKKLWLAIVPRSRRERTALLTDEVFGRVGGFMLGNLLTSLISGALTYVWLLVFGIPYALLLGLFVALMDLIPMVGSTLAGVVVSLVALTKGLPVAIATAAFYVLYRFLEDHLLNPQVMKHTVRVTPGLTIVASLVGASLLGLVGVLVAIPLAATAHLLLEEVAFPRQNQR